MIVVLSIAVLLLYITLLTTSIWLWKVLGKVERSTDRIIESLDSLHDVIKDVISYEPIHHYEDI